MHSITIAIEVPLKAAVAAGSAHWGPDVFTLTATHLAGLTPAGRDYVAAMTPLPMSAQASSDHAPVLAVWGRERLRCADGTPATVLATIDAAGAAREAEAAQVAAAKERAVLDLLAEPDEKWIAHGRTISPYVLHALHTDLRIIARRADIERRILPEVIREWEAAGARSREEQEAAKRAEAERASAFTEACRAYVMQYDPAFSRAAAGGYDVRGRARKLAYSDWTAFWLARGFTIITEDSAQRVREHKLPHNKAFGVLDAATAALPAEFRDGLIRPGAPVIVRIDTCPAPECEAGWRTAVKVPAHWADGSEADNVYLLADEAPPHEHSETGDDDA